jgi:hypothetical protein
MWAMAPLSQTSCESEWKNSLGNHSDLVVGTLATHLSIEGLGEGKGLV